MTKNYRHEAYRKELMQKEIEDQCRKYPYECQYLGSHIGTPKEINDMLKSVNNRKCSYT